MLGLKLNHVSKRGHRSLYVVTWRIRQNMLDYVCVKKTIEEPISTEPNEVSVQMVFISFVF